MAIIYKMKGDAVIIEDGFFDPIVVNLESIQNIIETIKANRHDYLTMKAYRRHLFKYEGALAFLSDHVGRTRGVFN